MDVATQRRLKFLAAFAVYFSALWLLWMGWPWVLDYGSPDFNPLILLVSIPFAAVGAIGLLLVTGTSLATGCPRLVITTGRLVAATSSSVCRQTSLNFPAARVFIWVL